MEVELLSWVVLVNVDAISLQLIDRIFNSPDAARHRIFGDTH
jgi:hypothetical protein